MHYAPNILMIGSLARNAGKTALACAVIRKCSALRDVVAVKVATVRRGGPEDTLPGKRGYIITQERGVGKAGASTGKALPDTQRFLAAGACKACWMRAMDDRLEPAAAALRSLFEPGTPVVCESTSLRRVLEPGAFILLRRRGEHPAKASAQALSGFADRILTFDGSAFDLDADDIGYDGSAWKVGDHVAS